MDPSPSSPSQVILPLAGLADPVKELARLAKQARGGGAGGGWGGKMTASLDHTAMTWMHRPPSPSSRPFAPRPAPPSSPLPQAAKLEKDLGGCTSRLDSPKFLAQAPEAIVAGLRAQASDLEQQLAAVAGKRAQMQRLAEAATAAAGGGKLQA